MKHVEYFGLTYQVPDETVAIATDRSGHVNCFSDVPVPGYAIWLGNRIAKLGRPAIVEPHWRSYLLVIENMVCELSEDEAAKYYLIKGFEAHFETLKQRMMCMDYSDLSKAIQCFSSAIMNGECDV